MPSKYSHCFIVARYTPQIERALQDVKKSPAVNPLALGDVIVGRVPMVPAGTPPAEVLKMAIDTGVIAQDILSADSSPYNLSTLRVIYTWEGRSSVHDVTAEALEKVRTERGENVGSPS